MTEKQVVERTDRGAVIGALDLHQDIRRAYWRSKRVDLTLSEFTIVCCLATQSGDDVTYRHIHKALHGEDFAVGLGSDGHRGNVRCFIKRIREKFRAVDPDFDGIENYPGFGYRWRETAGEARPT